MLCNMNIDELDARLIETLHENPRVGLLEVARRLGVARGTVQARLAKLEARGVITGPSTRPRWATRSARSC
jgi:DNA-binding Lrp family transcriptional regulator